MDSRIERRNYLEQLKHQLAEIQMQCFEQRSTNAHLEFLLNGMVEM